MPVIGTDNASPIYDPAHEWRVFDYGQIYLGQEAAGKYVPNVGDRVDRVIGNRLAQYRVSAVSDQFIPTLDRLEAGYDQDTPAVEDDLLDSQMGVYPHLFNLYMDRSKRPFVLNLDAHLPFYGDGARFIRVFQGDDTTSTGVVISRKYTNAGILESDQIALQLASGVENNTGIRYVPEFHTNVDLPEGSICSVVTTNTAGVVTSIIRVKVVYTASVLPTDLGRRYVTGLRLESPYLASPNASVLNVPLGAAISSISLRAVVEYNDGQVSLPVDNVAVKILGMQDVLTLSAGCEYPIQVLYTCQSNEINAIGVQGNARIVSRDYTLKINAGQANYGFHLVPVLTWVSQAQGYSLRWFLYSLDRHLSAEVTQYVSLNVVDGDAFQPKGYGIAQSLLASVDVHNADARYASATHVQRVTVVLDREGTERQTNWVIGFSPAQNPRYGLNLKARAQNLGSNNWQVRVDNGQSSLAEWLQELYYKTLPPYNTVYEAGPVEPNYFAVILAGVRVEYPIVSWNQPLTIVAPTAANHQTVMVEFIRRVVDDELLLSRAPMPLYQIDGAGNYV